MGVRTRVRQLHKDQKGFTLLEVLIAMFILVIIAVPLCRVYVSAAQTNAKARKQASATAVAENTMEGINAFSYDDVIRQFEEVSDGEFLICQNVSQRHGSVGADGKAVYVLEGVGEDAYQFDVRVTIDPSVYERENESDDRKVNDYELVAMSGYNSAKDYLYVLAEGSLRSYFGLDYDSIHDQVNRKLRITVTKEGTGEDQGVVVSAEVGYWRNTESEPTVLEPCGAQRFEGEDALRSVYLCYEPNYAAGFGAGQDKIEIINTDNVEFDLYLIKQSCPTWSDLAARETLYAPQITVEEGQWAEEDQGSYIKIYNNYGTNLALDSAISDAPVSYRYRYRGAEDGAIKSETGRATDTALAQALYIGGSAVHTERRFRMFSVTVEVYEAGAYAENFDGSTKPRVTAISNQ